MLTQALWTSLRILVFRAGPEDFPYDTGQRLNFACIVFGVLANTVLFLVLAASLPVPPSLLLGAAIGIATVAAMAVFTRVALRARQLDNRFQQTFNALLVTSSLLGLAMALPMHALQPFLPSMQEFLQKLNADPDLAKSPAALPQLPGWVPLLSMLLPWLLVWQFIVTVHIYRHATGTRTSGAILIAVLCVLVIASFKSIVTALLN